MTRNQARAETFKALLPGLNVILMGLVLFVLIRKVDPHNSDVAMLVYVVSHLSGLALMWFGYSRKVANRVEEDEAEKTAFIRDMQKAACMPPADESESFAVAVKAGMSLEASVPVGTCWAYDLERERDSGAPYRVRVFIAFGRTHIGLAIVYGLEGVWHKSNYMVAQYTQTGAVFELHGAFGDLTSLAGNGSRIVAHERREGPPNIMLASSKVTDLFESNLPPCLAPYMAEELSVAHR